jgi:hypothetical protein
MNQLLYYNSGGNLTNGGSYLLYGDQDSVESATQILINRSGTLRDLYVMLGSAPGGITTRTFTVNLNGVATTLVVTITGASTTGSNTVDTVAVVVNDLLSIFQDRTGGTTASGAQVSLSLT